MAGTLALLDRKRLELARALATQPQLLLLDEIAGGLTEPETHELVDEIRRVKEHGVTIVWIEHVVHALLAVADRLLVINFGKQSRRRASCCGDGRPRSAACLSWTGGVTMSALLETRALSAFYGDFQALFGIDVTVAQGEVIALIGSNGAGKSTFLKSVAGLLRTPCRADRLPGRSRRRRGGGEHRRQGHCAGAGRRGACSRASQSKRTCCSVRYCKRPGRWNLQSVYALFPALQERRHHPATALSGGQQQMVAIGRALMSNPDLLMCDELSLGLAPVIVREIYAALPAIVADGMSAIVVEQDVQLARRVSSRFYCFQEGRVSLAGVSAEVSDEAITQAYFGAVA